nr:bifunctional dethiobiotin synthetase/7,8-diamino-pelargonic acid aminotransferase, mitochondrial [Ipomoea batatas]
MDQLRPKYQRRTRRRVGTPSPLHSREQRCLPCRSTSSRSPPPQRNHRLPCDADATTATASAPATVVHVFLVSRFAKGKAVSRRKIGDFGVNEVFNKFGDFERSKLRRSKFCLSPMISYWCSSFAISDNGSTTLKMALRKFLFDHKVLLENSNGNGAGRYIDLKVLALRGSYHGDTLGAMEA